MKTDFNTDFKKVLTVLKTSITHDHVRASDRMFELLERKWKSHRDYQRHYPFLSLLYNHEKQNKMQTLKQ